MQKEIEIKAKIRDIAKTREKIEKLGAEFMGIKKQKDIYFSPAQGERFINNIKFRIRQENEEPKGSLDYHVSGNQNENVAQEYEVEVGDVKIIRQILEKLNFKQEAIVSKTRYKYQLNGFHFDIDEVENLGNFLEIEKIVKEEASVNEENILAKIKELFNQLDISEENFLPAQNRYLNLILNKI